MNSMDYELAKKLKDSGFPMGMTDHELCVYQQAEIFDGVAYHVPSLPELIDACENGYLSIVRVKEGDWRCFTENPNGLPKLGGEGSTPEEAVANLYLELNKNKNGEAQ